MSASRAFLYGFWWLWMPMTSADARPAHCVHDGPVAAGGGVMGLWGYLLGHPLSEPPQCLMERFFVGAGLDAPSPLCFAKALSRCGRGSKNALALAFFTHLRKTVKRRTQRPSGAESARASRPQKSPASRPARKLMERSPQATPPPFAQCQRQPPLPLWGKGLGDGAKS